MLMVLRRNGRRQYSLFSCHLFGCLWLRLSISDLKRFSWRVTLEINPGQMSVIYKRVSRLRSSGYLSLACYACQWIRTTAIHRTLCSGLFVFYGKNLCTRNASMHLMRPTTTSGLP